MPDLSEKNYYLTFGVQYAAERHPRWDGADPDGWVKIVAHSKERARDLAVAFFGTAWSMLYEASDFDEIDQKRFFYVQGELAVITEDEGMELSQPLRTLRRRGA